MKNKECCNSNGDGQFCVSAWLGDGPQLFNQRVTIKVLCKCN